MTPTDTHADDASLWPLPPAVGMIDMHCHLLPGIDDGCEHIEQTIECITRLKDAGFVGSICTPHVWPELFPNNTKQNIIDWTLQLSISLKQRGIDYPLWPGGEVRLAPDSVGWFKAYGVPTLAGSRCVLVDLWVDRWPKYVEPAIRWLQDHQYQPILAHPERINCPKTLEKNIKQLADMGVWLQGNTRCLTGEEGLLADRFVRQFIRDKWYRFMALDLHQPDMLAPRLEGVDMLVQEFGKQTALMLLGGNQRSAIFQ